MTKTIRLSLVALSLVSTSIFTVEAASAASLLSTTCRGGHILPQRCLKSAFAQSVPCRCDTVGADLVVTEIKSGRGTRGDSDIPDEEVTVDER